jgi:hypothetical protein
MQSRPGKLKPLAKKQSSFFPASGKRMSDFDMKTQIIEATRTAIKANPDKAAQATIEPSLEGWFVDEVRIRLWHHPDPRQVECVVTCEIAAEAERRRLRAALATADKHIEWSSKIALAYLDHDNPVNMAEGKSQQYFSLHDHSTIFAKTVRGEIQTALALDPAEPMKASVGADGAQDDSAQHDGVKTRLDQLRANGWSVAVHNDYRLGGVAHTFWLFTKGDRAIKGEGLTDEEALDQCRARIQNEVALRQDAQD